jgi:capsular polysaccharide biosynthesis protein
VSTEQVRARPLRRGELNDGRWPAPPSQRSGGDWLLVGLVSLAIVTAALVSALAVVTTKPKVYGARADLLYVSSPSAPLDARDRMIATQRDLITSRAVLAPVAAHSGIPLDKLEKAVSVDVGVRNDLMHVTLGDRNQARAERLARAVTTRYLALARRLTSAADAEGPRLEGEIAQLTARARRALPAERDVIAERVAALEDRAVALGAASSEASKPMLLAPAYRLEHPLSPKPLRAAALGLIVGLMLAAVAAVALVRPAGGRPAP